MENKLPYSFTETDTDNKHFETYEEEIEMAEFDSSVTVCKEDEI